MQTRRAGTFLAALALVAVLPGRRAGGSSPSPDWPKATNRCRKTSTRAKDDHA